MASSTSYASSIRNGFSEARVCSRSQGQPSGLRRRAMIPRRCSKRVPEGCVIVVPEACDYTVPICTEARRDAEGERHGGERCGGRVPGHRSTAPGRGGRAAARRQQRGGPTTAGRGEPHLAPAPRRRLVRLPGPPAPPTGRSGASRGCSSCWPSSAVVALGQAADPMTGQVRDKDPDAAADAIDLLVLLREKTEGHRTPRRDAAARRADLRSPAALRGGDEATPMNRSAPRRGPSR